MAHRAARVRTPTCATRADGALPAGAPAPRGPGAYRPRVAPACVGRPQSRAGFTLVELLVVLAIASLLLTLVPVALQRLRDAIAYQDTVRGLTTELRRARQLARTEGRDVRLTVDLARRRYGIGPAPARELPDALNLRVTIAGIEWSERQVGAIRFLPQGGATGGHLDVLRPDGSGVRLTVDWLSGTVSQSPLKP